MGFALTVKLTFSSAPYDYNYICLKNLSRYICITLDWGNRYKRRGLRLDIPEPKFHLIVWEKYIPKTKQDIDKGELMCFVDAAYGNDTTNIRSTTGFYFTFYGGEVVYRSKT